MPEDNPNIDEIAAAVERGLKQALGGPELDNLIARFTESSERKRFDDLTSSRASTFGYEKRAKQAEDISWKRWEEATAPDAPVSAGDGPSKHASDAKSLLGRVGAGLRGDKPFEDVFGQQYYTIPPSFGPLKGGITAQNLAKAAMLRNLEKAARAEPDSDEQKAYIRSGRRANFFANEVIPNYEAGKKMFQQYVQPTYRAMQGLSNYGATQIGGEVGGNIEIGGFGFRNPFNSAFEKGLDMKFHQMGQAVRSGVNMQQMAEIDNTLMGMGFNFNNNQFKTGEMALENITRFNPSIRPQQAGALLDQTLRFGNVNEVAHLTRTINNLNAVAAGANVSTEQLTQQLGAYAQLAGQSGVSSAYSIPQGAELARTMPGIDPTKNLQTLMNNPMAQQQVMKMGYMPYQAGAMSPSEQQRALTSAMGSVFQNLTGKSIGQVNSKFLNSKPGELAISDMINLYGFQGYSPEEIKNVIDYAPQRSAIDKAESKYFNKNKNGEIIANVKGIKTHSGSWYDLPAVSGKQANESEINKILKSAGIKDPKQMEEIKRDLVTSGVAKDRRRGGHDWILNADWEKKLLRDLDKARGPDNKQDISRDNFDKLVNSLDTAAQAARGLKDAQGKDGGGKNNT